MIAGERVGTLYVFSSCIDHVVSLAAGKNEKTTLWHRKLSHLSKNGMRILKSMNALIGMEDASFDFCEDCLYDKLKRVSFMKDGREKKFARLELVHEDVWGPSPTKSLGSNSYIETFIDNARCPS